MIGEAGAQRAGDAGGCRERMQPGRRRQGEVHRGAPRAAGGRLMG